VAPPAEPARRADALPPRSIVDVAVGVLLRADGRFLLASRPEGKPYAHYWEFPGGKLEPGESVAHALGRELHEELGVDIGIVLPWVVREFEYPHAHVRLHFCRVIDWRGTPHPREGQALHFATLDDLPPGPLLPATVPVLRWLDLPPVLAVTDAAELGAEEFLQRLRSQLAAGLRMVLLREPALPVQAAGTLFGQVLAAVRAADARLVVSSRHPSAWAAAADGVHLTARDLMAGTQRPAGTWVGASVHDAAELAQAAALGLDYAVLGPVAATRSHPGAAVLGWQGFRTLASSSAIPLYALGGLVPGDLPAARQAGAHGIALQRAAWPAPARTSDG